MGAPVVRGGAAALPRPPGHSPRRRCLCSIHRCYRGIGQTGGGTQSFLCTEGVVRPNETAGQRHQVPCLLPFSRGIPACKRHHRDPTRAAQARRRRHPTGGRRDSAPATLRKPSVQSSHLQAPLSRTSFSTLKRAPSSPQQGLRATIFSVELGARSCNLLGRPPYLSPTARDSRDPTQPPKMVTGRTSSVSSRTAFCAPMCP